MSDASGQPPTSARALLGLAPTVDDATFIGTPQGSSREEIIAAARARLGMLARNAALTPEIREAARIEIRDAARRLAAESIAAAEATVTQPAQSDKPAQPVSSERSQRVIFDSLATASFMRRDPRRARMFYARMVEPRTQDAARGGSSASRVQRTNGGDGEFELEYEITGERRQRLPWMLGCFVVLSLLVLIVEIAYLRNNAQSAEDAAAPSEQPTEVAPAEPTLPRGEVDDGKPKEFASQAAVSATPVAKAPAATSNRPESTGASEASEANRKLRDRWQRMAATALEIQPVSEFSSDELKRDDPLAVPLREIMVLERLLALDLAARQLFRGGDEEASLLLDTLPPDATVTLPEHPLVALVIAPDHDGELEKGLHKSPGATESRASRLRIVRARAEAPGPHDARTLVHEALKGPSRTTRTIAQGILVDRGHDSRDVLEAVEERFTEIANDPALAGMIRALSGVDPAGIDGSSAARGAILNRILQLRGSRQPQVDRACEDLAATLRKCAGQFEVTTTASDPSGVLRAIVKATGGSPRQPLGSTRSVVQSFVQDGTVLLHEEASALKVRRPADGLLIDDVVQRASAERAKAASALGGAIANARGALTLDALRLVVSPIRDAAVSARAKPEALSWGSANDQAVIDQWSTRLEALTAGDAGGYFELGEEVADASDSEGSRLLARQLFALAGAMTPEAYGASSALALAALDAHRREQWRAVAERFSEHVATSDLPDAVRGVGSAVRGAVIEAIVQYRRGFGRRASERLKPPLVRALFESVMRSVPGGIAEFDRLASIHLKGEGTPLDAATIDALLRVEQALLQPRSDRWAVALALGGDDAIVDAPLGTAQEVFGVEAGRDRWRGDRWASAADR